MDYLKSVRYTINVSCFAADAGIPLKLPVIYSKLSLRITKMEKQIVRKIEQNAT